MLDRVDIERHGRGVLTEILRDIPELAMTGITDQVSISTTRGVVGADLRGLGSGNTLVLVDGRRVTVSANAFFQTTFVDLNRFPIAAIERVEVIKGGASAVHGPDAVAGVVNLVTRRAPSGIETEIGYGSAFATDVRERRVAVTASGVRGAWSGALGLEYFDRSALMARDRWFSRSAVLTPRFTAAYDYFARQPASQLSGYDGRYVFGPYPVVAVVSGQVNGVAGVDVPGLPPGAPITGLPGTGATPAEWLSRATTGSDRGATVAAGMFVAGVARTFVPAEFQRNNPSARNLYDFQAVNGLLPAVSRTGGLGRVGYRFPGGVELFSTWFGQRQRTHTTLTPARLSLTVPRTNYFNPFGVAVNVDWSPLEPGTRRSLNENDSFGGTVGLRSAAEARWTWEVAANFSRDEYTDVFIGGFSAPRTAAALARTNAQALNPFGGPAFRHDPAIWSELIQPTWVFGRADLTSIDGRVGGAVFQFPGGEARSVVYAEARRERLARTSDPESREGRVLAASRSGADSAWRRDVGALAAEFEAPLLRGAAPGSPLLAVHVAARAEAFAAAPDSGIRPAATLTSQPAGWLRLSASTARTFRAPTLLQLFAPQSTMLTNTAPDPRRPIALTGDILDGANVQRTLHSGGNPELQPEQGRSYHLGVTLMPLWAANRGLAVDVSWFRYDLDGLIIGPGVGDILLNELGATRSLVVRDPGTVTYVNRTDAGIPMLVGPAGQMRIVQPGESVTVPGRLREITTYAYNLARRRTTGTDVALRWRRADAGFGAWQWSVAATYFDEMSDSAAPSAPLINRIGAPGQPRWRWQSGVDWERGSWSGGTSIRFMGSSGDLGAEGMYQKPYRPVSLYCGYEFARAKGWLKDVRASLHVDDVFDEEPPLVNDPPVGYNYTIVSRPQGPTWRVTLRKRW